MPRLDVIGMVSLTLCCYFAVPSDQAQCGIPPKLENMLLNSDWDTETFSPGHTVIYACHPGYTSMGRFKMACLEGKWHVLNRGQCKKKSCGHPGDIPFGTFELKNGYEFVFGAEVEYSCDDGYQMVSRHSTRICAVHGWTNHPPDCEARLCPPVMDDSVRVSSSVADDEFSVGHVINLKCKNPKHTLNGPSQLYCTEEGTWNVDPPTCTEPCNIQETDMRKNNIQLKNNRGLHVKGNEDVHFECSYGYNISDPAKLTIQCNNGVLEYPTCQEIAMKPCGRPPQISYGEITEPVYNTYDSGSSVTYKCQHLFTTYGPETIQCHDGIWGEPPACLEYQYQEKKVPKKTVKKPCGKPPPVLHGEITEHMNDTYKSGSSVTYKCQQFSAVLGKRKIKCEDGKWGKPPVCLVKKPCGRPPYVPHGEITTAIKNIYNSSSSVTYKCQKLYTIHGSKVIKCQEGIWNEAPSCLAPCTTSEAQMHENHIALIWKKMINKNQCNRSDQNEKNAEKCYVKHSETIEFACLPGYMIYDQMELRTTCDRGNLSYPRCLEEY